MTNKLFDDPISLDKFLQKCYLNSDSEDSITMQEWDEDSGGDSFLYEACTDLIKENIEDYGDEGISDEDKIIIPDTPSPDSSSEEAQLDKEIGEFKGLLEELGLRYNDVVKKQVSSLKGMTMCEISCQTDMKTKLIVKLARRERSEALIAAVKKITEQVKKKYFPEKVIKSDQYREHKLRLLKFCKNQKKPSPVYSSRLEGGMYCAKVSVGVEEVSDNVAFNILTEAEGSAAKLWLRMFGGVVGLKNKHANTSAVFSYETNDDNNISKDSVPNKDVCNVKNTKKAVFFGTIDNLYVENGVPPVCRSVPDEQNVSQVLDRKKAFALLDKKAGTNWSTRDEATVIPINSPFALLDKEAGKKWSPRDEATVIPRKSPFALLDKEAGKNWSPRDEATVIPRRSPFALLDKEAGKNWSQRDEATVIPRTSPFALLDKEAGKNWSPRDEATMIPRRSPFALLDKRGRKNWSPRDEATVIPRRSPFALLDKEAEKNWSPRDEATVIPRRSPFALLDKKGGKNWSPRDEATVIPKRSPRKHFKAESVLQITKKRELMKEVFDDSSLSVASQEDSEEDENKMSTKRARSISIDEKSSKKRKPDQAGLCEESVVDNDVPGESTIQTSKKLDKKVSRTRAPIEENSESRRLRNSELKCNDSPKKKVGMFGKLSMKVDQEVKVKPKFQFNHSQRMEKNETTYTFCREKLKTKEDASDIKGPTNQYTEPVEKVNDVESAVNKDNVGCAEINGNGTKTLRSNSIKKKSGETPTVSAEKDVRKGKKTFGDLGEHKSPVKKSFKFSDKDKIVAKNKSKKSSTNNKVIEEKSRDEPIKEQRECISSVFEHEDDPDVLLIMERKKREAEELAARTLKKAKGRKRESMAKMAEFSQGLAENSSQECSSDDTVSNFKIPKQRKPRTTKKKPNDPSQRKIISFYINGIEKPKPNKEEIEVALDFTPSIDELLKIPDRPEDGGKTMDEVLDDLDKEIAERKKQHEAEMAKIDTDIAAEKRRQEERRERLKRNAMYRDQLETEITEPVLREMFRNNLEYLQNIQAGKIPSSRHVAFHKSCRTRHALLYKMITDPFTDNQLDWTLEEMGKVWMRNKREQMDNNEYVWKVLLAECFIKFYMDHFGVDKKEAERRISETPLRKSENDSDSETDDENA